MQVVPTVTVRINLDSDTVLSNGFVIPRRTTVTTSLIHLHMNPELYEEPER
jgi:cytochrome P450